MVLFWNLILMLNCKMDVNNNCGVFIDYILMNYEWLEVDYVICERLF